MEINVLELLDEMDEFRRNQQNSNGSSADWCMRVLESIVAEHAGYLSRNEWTKELFADKESMYYRDCVK